MDLLKTIRAAAGPRRTIGLPDEVIEDFLMSSNDLSEAITMAHDYWKTLDADSTYSKAEELLIQETAQGWCLFYKDYMRAPYIPIAAKGSWLVTLHGAVLNDSGGYGMLGFGHAPAVVLEAMSRPCTVMANVITPSLSQIRFNKAIRNEVGHTRATGCPYSQFLFMNSGSEANAVLDRIVDVTTGHLLSSDLPDAKRGYGKILTVSLEGCFHGRTFKPAVWTHSCTESYINHRCHSINEAKAQSLRTVKPNDCLALQNIFDEAETAGDFIELVIMEAVMGEGKGHFCL